MLEVCKLCALLLFITDGARQFDDKHEAPTADGQIQSGETTGVLHRMNLDNGLGIANASTYLGFADGQLGTGLGATTIGSWAPAAGRCIAGLMRLKAMLAKVAGTTVTGDESKEVEELIQSGSYLKEAMSNHYQTVINDEAQIEVYSEALQARTELWNRLADILGHRALISTTTLQSFMDISLDDRFMDINNTGARYQWTYQCSGCASCKLGAAFRQRIAEMMGVGGGSADVRELAGGDCFETSCKSGEANMPEFANKGTLAILGYDKRLQNTMLGAVQYFIGLTKKMGDQTFGKVKAHCYRKTDDRCRRFNKMAAVVAKHSATAVRGRMDIRRNRLQAEETYGKRLAEIAAYASNLLSSPAGSTLVAGIQLLRTVFPPQAGFSLLLTPYSACDVGHRLVDFAAAVQQQTHSCLELNNEVAQIDQKANEEAEAALSKAANDTALLQRCASD